MCSLQKIIKRKKKNLNNVNKWINKIKGKITIIIGTNGTTEVTRIVEIN